MTWQFSKPFDEATEKYQEMCLIDLKGHLDDYIKLGLERFLTTEEWVDFYALCEWITRKAKIFLRTMSIGAVQRRCFSHGINIYDLSSHILLEVNNYCPEYTRYEYYKDNEKGRKSTFSLIKRFMNELFEGLKENFNYF